MSLPASGVPRVLHIHGSMAADNRQAMRCVRLMEAFGGRLHHSIAAGDSDFGALAQLSKGVPVERLSAPAPLGGLPLPGRLQRWARVMIGYDLVLTYGRGGIMAALAHTSFGEVHALPPLIHHEDGSDETAGERGGWRSKWPRRVGLGKAAGLVVPNETMEAVALIDWQQPLGRVKSIADGVDLARFARPPRANGIGRLLKRKGEHWIGCLTDSDSGGKLPKLVETIAALEEHWHLVIVGDHAARERIDDAAAGLAIQHRVHFAKPMANHAEAIAMFDILAVADDRDPLPLCVIEAMAAGLPVAGLDPVEAAAALDPDNAALGEDALEHLAADEDLRATIGAANRSKAEAERGEAAMIASYWRLYTSAMRRDTI